MGDSQGRVYEKRSVSFHPDQIKAITEIVRTEKRMTFSGVVQDAVDELIERREQVAESREEQEAAVV